MNEILLDAFGGIDDEYIISAIHFVRQGERSKITYIRRFVIIAAALCMLLAAAACAAVFYSQHFRSPEPEEQFSYQWSDKTFSWDNAQLAISFDGAEECEAIEIKPGWLPFEPSQRHNPDYYEDGWCMGLRSEGVEFPDIYDGMTQPYMISIYYAPQFTDGGALLLLYNTPEKIEHEQWDDIEVTKIYTTRREDIITGKYKNGNYILLFDSSKGYIISVCGEIPMEDLEHIARTLEVRGTGIKLHKKYFSRSYEFFDIGVG